MHRLHQFVPYNALDESVGCVEDQLVLVLADKVRNWQPSDSLATAAIVGTSVAYASTAIFVRQLTDTGMSVIAVAFFRFALTALVLVGFLNWAPSARPATIWGLGSGAAMGGGWIIYVRTIDTADVAVAGVVQMTYPIFALLTGWLLFHKGPTARSIASAMLIVLAAILGLGASSHSGLSLMLFAAPASFGFSVAVLTERLGVLDPFERLAAVAVGAAVAMTPLMLMLPAGEALPTSVGALVWVLAIGAISALIPMTIYASVAPVLGTARTTSAGASELPIVFLIGAVFFGEHVSLGQIASAAIIIGAISLTRPDCSNERPLPIHEHPASRATAAA